MDMDRLLVLPFWSIALFHCCLMKRLVDCWMHAPFFDWNFSEVIVFFCSHELGGFGRHWYFLSSTSGGCCILFAFWWWWLWWKELLLLIVVVILLCNTLVGLQLQLLVVMKVSYEGFVHRFCMKVWYGYGVCYLWRRLIQLVEGCSIREGTIPWAWSGSSTH